jgi:hypothetical protein
MPRYLLQHEHEPSECGAAYAAWKGFDSPLRHAATLASCLEGGHTIWWNVEAPDACAALGLLPPYVATRTTPLAVSEVCIP